MLNPEIGLHILQQEFSKIILYAKFRIKFVPITLLED